ncbi:hypothetical protein MNBD_GAMMA06-2218 [hydrothermal vent metagenome]|uniref:histidine kinase n=1 Tax=hydrothermal vent metagenome TaxID=652676 RepID=A0A3B0WZ61_9ZZZZ
MRKEKNGQLHVEVRDSGIGIAENLTESIFDEFSQLNNPERDRNKGLGLGLTIVKRLCKLLGHEINVKSACESGSIFTVTAPLSKKTSMDAVIEEEVLIPTRLKLSLSVLVIDDNKTILTAMHGILTHWGCKTVCASSADQAQQLLSEQALIPDAIIADFRLCNNLTGIQAIQQICHSLSKNLPALLITGDTGKKRLLEAKESEYDLLHKPIHPDKLYSWLYNNRPETHH